jgi:hypothetical protein
MSLIGTRFLTNTLFCRRTFRIDWRRCCSTACDTTHYGRSNRTIASTRNLTHLKQHTTTQPVS